ncbi:MAG: hypothetical protein AB7P14_26635 [Blastocatellales bacterium]
MHSRIFSFFANLIITLFLTVITFSPAGVVHSQQTNIEILPGQGVLFYQVKFTWSAPPTFSGTGLVDVEPKLVLAAIGQQSGYLNVLTSEGWVVQNLPLLSSFPYTLLSTAFRLKGISEPGEVTSLDAYVEFSPQPQEAFSLAAHPGISFRMFSVAAADYNAQGELEYPSAPGVSGTALPPLAPAVGFQTGGDTETAIQPNHVALQAKKNQCLPAAVGSSFEWLSRKYGVFIPDKGANLLAELDSDMNRMDQAPTVTEFGLIGRMKYIGKNRLRNILFQHLDSMGLMRDVSWEGLDGIRGTADDVTSIFAGPVEADPIIDEVGRGTDIELGFRYIFGMVYLGGHRVEVVGAGKVLGVPWVMHQSDHVQGDDNQGTERVDFTYLFDVNSNGQLNLVNNVVDGDAYSVFLEIPAALNCRTICLRSAQYYLQHLNGLPYGAVLIGGNNYNARVSTVDAESIRMALQGKAWGYGVLTPLQQLNREFVAFQLSLMLAGGEGSPVVFTALNSSISCYGNKFSIVRLSNGETLNVNSRLGDLVNQAVLAIRENRTGDMSVLAQTFHSLNGTDPLGRCGQ